MTQDLVHEIKLLVAETFSWPYEQLTEETGPGTIPRWDSLGHIQLLEAIVTRFEIDIPVEQAVEAGNIGALARIVAASTQP